MVAVIDSAQRRPRYLLFTHAHALTTSDTHTHAAHGVGLVQLPKIPPPAPALSYLHTDG